MWAPWPAPGTQSLAGHFIMPAPLAGTQNAIAGRPFHHAGPSFRHSIDRKHAPYPDSGLESRGGVGCGNDTRTLPPTNASNFHTLVCRHQPAWAIGTKMMWRGFDSASESHQSPVPSFRRKPESRGVGRGDCSAGACPQLRTDRSFAQVARPGVPSFSSSYAAVARPW